MKTITTDPVCGMDVDSESSLSLEHEGVRYLFCSAGCMRRFQKTPSEFVMEDGDAQDDLGEEVNEKPVHRRQQDRGKSWKDYLPLLVIVMLTASAAVAKQFAYDTSWDGMAWMHDFMGFFLVVFSMFKFFDLSGFADGFQMYDLLAKPVRAYAYVYPFLELGLGLGYLAHWQGVYVATIVLMVFGSLGVIRSLIKGLDLQCACMGTVLKVPLSTVALVEDLGMAGMALAMLLAR